MTSIGIIGLGKMGTAITKLLEAEEDVILHAFNRLSAKNQPVLEGCDVVIEFTTAEAAPDIIQHCITSGIPVVSGTTGWQEYHLETIKKLCSDKKGKFLFASNFSIGMNITFALNQKLAQLMNAYPQFKASILEKHHVHKKDAPSGTAYTLIEGIVAHHGSYDGFQLNVQNPDSDKIPVTAVREGEIKGIHEVKWNSGLEQVMISHEAFDRRIFAEGAILAAKWLKDKRPGIYTMNDIIGL